MTPRISDAEVEAFVALTKTPMGLKSALAAFLAARVPDAMPDDNDECFGGFNACREAVLKGRE